MKKLIVVAVALLALGSFWAAADSGVLEIWADETRAPIWSSLADDIETQFGLPVEVTDFGKPEPLDDAFKSGAASGEGPDILLGIHDRIGTLISSGLLEPINISSALREQFNPGALAAFTSGGNLYGIPYATEAIVMYRNTDLVADEPASFEDMLATCDALGDAIEFCVTWSINQFFFSLPFLTANGGFVFNDGPDGLEGCNMGLDNEGAIAGAEFMRQLVVDGHTPAQGIGYGEAISLFKEGRAAFHINGPWELAGFRNDGFNFAVQHIPSFGGAQPLPFLGVQGFMISAFSDNKTLAAAVLTDYFATLDVQRDFFLQDQRTPVFLPLLEDPAVAEDEALVVVGSAPGVPTPNIPEMGNVWGAMDNALTLIVSGQESAESALANAVATIKAANNCEE